MAADNYLAIDLGAESGRLILGRLEGERLALEEIHRFPNGPVRVHDALHERRLFLDQLFRDDKSDLLFAKVATEKVQE